MPTNPGHSLEAFVQEAAFPCLGARAAFNTGRVHMGGASVAAQLVLPKPFSVGSVWLCDSARGAQNFSRALCRGTREVFSAGAGFGAGGKAVWLARGMRPVTLD